VQGVREVAEAMRGGCLAALRSLDLSENSISDSGLAMLLAATTEGHAPSLTSLCLERNRISGEGFAGGPWGLTRVVLNRNNVTPAGVGAMIAALPRLRELHLGGDHVEDDEASHTHPAPFFCPFPLGHDLVLLVYVFVLWA
jgi:hypothetical protein